MDAKQANVVEDILVLCRDNPGHPVFIENVGSNGRKVPLVALMSTARKRSPFLYEGSHLLVVADNQPPMTADALGMRLAMNPSLPIGVHVAHMILDLEKGPSDTIHAVRVEGETLTLDAAPPDPMRDLRRLCAKHPDSQVVYIQPYFDPLIFPGEPSSRPVTATEIGTLVATSSVILLADPNQSPLRAGDLLAQIETEIGDGQGVALKVDYPDDDGETGIYLEDVDSVRLIDDGTIAIYPVIVVEDAPPLSAVPIKSPVEIGDIITGNPGWAWGQRLGEFVFVSDDPEQHRAFKFETLSVQGWAYQQESILLAGIRSLYKPTNDQHTAYDERREQARFWVQAIHLYRQGRITHLEGVPHRFEPGDALLVDAVRLNTMGAVDMDAERIRFVQAGLYDGDQYAMRARPKKVGSVYSKDETVP